MVIDLIFESGLDILLSTKLIWFTIAMELYENKENIGNPAIKAIPIRVNTPIDRSLVADCDSGNLTPYVQLRRKRVQQMVLMEKEGNCSQGPSSFVKSPTLQLLRDTPVMNSRRSMLESQLSSTLLNRSSVPCKKESPGLVSLRNTPAKPIVEKRYDLEKLHAEIRNKSDELNTGGGVTIWPQMNNMRLSRQEFTHIIIISVCLAIGSTLLFQFVHGDTIADLQVYTAEANKFISINPINTEDSDFSQQCVRWHQNHLHLVEKLEARFDYSGVRLPIAFYVLSTTYLSGIIILLYYLADNVMSPNKLSPNRIRKWLCLLVVIGCWTINMARMFILSFQIESQLQNNVHKFSDIQKDLIHSNAQTEVYDRVLSYWSIRQLPPTTTGSISIMGILKFKDFLHYIQYYSLPIITALLTPLVSLIHALLSIYGIIDTAPEKSKQH